MARDLTIADKLCVVLPLFVPQIVGAATIISNSGKSLWDVAKLFFYNAQAVCTVDGDDVDLSPKLVPTIRDLNRHLEFIKIGGFRCIPVVNTVYYGVMWYREKRDNNLTNAFDLATKTLDNASNEYNRTIKNGNGIDAGSFC